MTRLAGGRALSMVSAMFTTFTMSENYNDLPRPEKSRRLLDEETEAIERWRTQYPELSDEELLEVENTFQRYAELVLEIAAQDEKKATTKED